MGLNICKKVLEKIGGGIWLKETHELGSTFCFNILLWGVTHENFIEQEAQSAKKNPQFKPKGKSKIPKQRKLKCTDLSLVPEVFEDSMVDIPQLLRRKKDGLKVLIAEDTYVHMALLGYILSSEIPADKLDIKLTNDGGQTFTVLMESVTNHCWRKMESD